MCSGCRHPWPCPATRRHLSILLRSDSADPFVVLAVLATCYHEAVADLPDIPAADLHRRFLS